MWSVSLFLSVTLVVCLPGQLYLAIATEFQMALADALPSLLALALAGTLAVASLVFALPTGRAQSWRQTGRVFRGQ